MTKTSTRAGPGDDEGCAREAALSGSVLFSRTRTFLPFFFFFQYSFPKLKTLGRVKKTSALVTCVKNLKRGKLLLYPF